MALASRRIKQFEIDPQELERQILSSMGTLTDTALLHTELTTSVKDIRTGSIVKATVDSVDERTGMVVMDIGGKSEGSIALAEFGEVLPKMGETYEVFYDGLDEHDTAQISKRRADRLRAWERVSTKYKEGDEVQGVVQRKIKGGLLVDVEGVNVFLP
ncbi:MAG TPA: 30S ribosomal protein S1, partial [Planctomycetota bacterium]|nr:30S ribosomal protein S1 [Planctomycetota bacterium]